MYLAACESRAEERAAPAPKILLLRRFCSEDSAPKILLRRFSRGDLLQGDFMAKLLQLPNEIAHPLFGSEAVEVLRPQVVIGDAVTQDDVRGGEDTVCDRHRRALLGPAASNAVELRGQITVLLPACGPRGLDQSPTQPAIPFAHPAGPRFPSRFPFTRTDPGPRHHIGDRREGGHVMPYFRDHVLCYSTVNPRNPVQPG